MKVLLLGNWSGMASQMCEGLRTFGHEVTLAAFQDGFKGNYGADIDLSEKHTGSPRLDAAYNLMKLTSLKEEYDVIHLQTPYLFAGSTLLFLGILKNILKSGKIISLSLAGDDYYYWKVSPQHLAYGPWQDTVKIDHRGRTPFFATRPSKFINDWTVRQADIIIPACYEYIMGYRDNTKIYKHIPFAFDVKSVVPKYPEEIFNRKIRILHAESRPGFKGSRHIMGALRRIEREHPDEVEVLFFKHVPYGEYKLLLEQTDIVLDQANSYSWGMNAVEALALGKVVFSGAESEALAFYGVKDCPIINMEPDEDQIYARLCDLLQTPSRLSVLGRESRAFAESFHGFDHVIPELVRAWRG